MSWKTADIADQGLAWTFRFLLLFMCKRIVWSRSPPPPIMPSPFPLCIPVPFPMSTFSKIHLLNNLHVYYLLMICTCIICNYGNYEWRTIFFLLIEYFDPRTECFWLSCDIVQYLFGELVLKGHSPWKKLSRVTNHSFCWNPAASVKSITIT